MTYYIYQIGDTPVFHAMKNVNGTPLTLDIKTQWDNPTATLSDVGGEISFLPATRSIVETQKVNIKGTATPSPTMSIRHFVERIKNLGGRRDVPIIVFRADDDVDCACGNCFSMDWLLGYVTFIDIPIKSETNSLNPYVWLTSEISLSGVLTQEFIRLSPWFWQYRDGHDRIFDPSIKPPDVDFPFYQFGHPTDIGEFKPDGYFFKWSSSESDYNPVFWGLKFNGISGGKGSDFVEFSDIALYSNPMEWSSIASGLYAFKGLGTSGTIQIEVQKRTGFFEDDNVTEISELDLAQLNSDLTAFGYGGLNDTDVIYTGVAEPLPGFIVRDGYTIPDVRPKWSYPGLYPGEPGYDFSTVTFRKENTQGQVAYLFEFGVY